MVSELRPCFMTTDSPLWSSRDLVKSYLETQHICSSQVVFLRDCSHRAGLSLPHWSGVLGAGLPRKRGALSWPCKLCLIRNCVGLFDSVVTPLS